MTQGNYIVEGRKFRTEMDYKLALKDRDKIASLREKTDFHNKKQLELLIKEIDQEKVHFYTMLGADFKEEAEDKLRLLEADIRKDGQLGKGLRKGRIKEKKPVKKKAQRSDSPGKGSHVAQADVEKELKKQEVRRRWVVICCSIAAIACLGYFFLYSYFDYKTEQKNTQLSALKDKPPAISGSGNGQPGIDHNGSEKEIPEVLEEYKTLVNKNKKLIGWLKIDDTNIDYPIMQTTNNEYYLDHNLNQEYDKNGSIFLDKDCDVIKPSTNFILYGHNMKSGQMFGKLDAYSSEDYFKDHRYIQFDTIYEKGKYEIMYVFRSRIYREEEIVFKYYQFIDALSQQEFDSYMEEMRAISMYDTGVTAQWGDQLLTLSTCDYSEKNGRFVVVAKKID